MKYNPSVAVEVDPIVLPDMCEVHLGIHQQLIKELFPTQLSHEYNAHKNQYFSSSLKSSLLRSRNRFIGGLNVQRKKEYTTDKFETLLLCRKLTEEAMSEAKVEGEARARLYKYLLSLLLFFYGGRLFFLAIATVGNIYFLPSNLSGT